MKTVVMGLAAIILMTGVGVANAENVNKEFVCNGNVSFLPSSTNLVSFKTPEIKVKDIDDIEKAVEKACDKNLEKIGFSRRFTRNFRIDLKCTVGDLSFDYLLNKDKIVSP